MEISKLRIIEIGPRPFVKSAFPAETLFFSIFSRPEETDPAAGKYEVTARTLPRLWRALQDDDLSLVVVQPTFYSPWHWRWLSRAVFDRRTLQGHLPLLRPWGPQLLRRRTKAPVAVLDQDDLPLIGSNNLFLLDRCHTFFKRELPVDHWQLFMGTRHHALPTGRFRRIARNERLIGKVRPISLGLPSGQTRLIPQAPVAKNADVFFAGTVNASSTVRTAGMAELLALRDEGIAVDIPEKPVPPAEYYQRCASAWLTWSPEGFGWDCFRHYEAPACRSVPVINYPTIDRHVPLIEGEHAFHYGVEPGGLTRCIRAALADKERLRRMAEAGRERVLAHHTPEALARYVVEETLGNRAIIKVP